MQIIQSYQSLSKSLSLLKTALHDLPTYDLSQSPTLLKIEQHLLTAEDEMERAKLLLDDLIQAAQNS